MIQLHNSLMFDYHLIFSRTFTLSLSILYQVMKTNKTRQLNETCQFLTSPLDINPISCVPYIPVTLQMEQPIVIFIRRYSPVLQLPSEVRMWPCDTVAKCPLPCTFYQSFKMFKISASEFGTVSMRRWISCHGIWSYGPWCIQGCDSVIYRCNTAT